MSVFRSSLAVLTAGLPLTVAWAQSLPPPPAGRYLCGVGSAPSIGRGTGSDYGSSRARLVLDGSNYAYETGGEPRRGTYRYDGAGKLHFLTGDLAGSSAEWGASPYRNQPGRFWFRSAYCDLSSS